MNKELNDDINMALNANVDMSTEDYAELTKKMDESTKNHGVKGKAPISESVRHKRIQSNFYATALNILINMYQLLAEMDDSLKELRDGRKGKDE